MQGNWTHNRCIKELCNSEEESAVEVQQQLLNGILRWSVTRSYMLVSKGCTSNTADDDGIRLHKVNISLISFPSTYLGFFFCNIVICNNLTHTVTVPPLPLSLYTLTHSFFDCALLLFCASVAIGLLLLTTVSLMHVLVVCPCSIDCVSLCYW